MPDPTRLLRTLRQAAAAFRATPGRRGRFVALDADEVFATGDLHGNLDNFRRLLQKANLAAHPRRHFVLQEVVHGPHRYPAGGDKSHQLLDLVAALVCQYPGHVSFLLGNHELSQWTARRIGKADDDLNEQFRQGVATAYGPHAAEIYAAHGELFASAPLALRTANRVFLSHSLPPASRLADWDFARLQLDELDEKDLLPGGVVHSLVWGRDTSQANAEAFLRLVDADLLISGHIPCEPGYDAPNDRQLILDSMGASIGYCLFPTDRPLSHADLLHCVSTL